MAGTKEPTWMFTEFFVTEFQDEDTAGLEGVASRVQRRSHRDQGGWKKKTTSRVLP